MRRTTSLLRSAKGYGWYNQYVSKGPESFLKNVPPAAFDWEKIGTDIVRPKAFMEISIDGDSIGKLVFELASDILPQTVDNFSNLIQSKGKYSYKNSKIHNVNKGVAIMGGDVEDTNGKLSHSSYTVRYFPDENYVIPHTGRGLLSMASIGRNTNGSQFYLSLAKNPHLNGKCMVFGRLIEGEDVLKQIESVFTVRLVPVRDIRISNCGLV